jgi:PAS domain S-box-containing protein
MNAPSLNSVGSAGYGGAIRLLVPLVAASDPDIAGLLRAALPQIAGIFGADELALARSDSKGKALVTLHWKASGVDGVLTRIDLDDVLRSIGQQGGALHEVLTDLGPQAGLAAYALALGEGEGILLFTASPSRLLQLQTEVATLVALGQGLSAAQARVDRIAALGTVPAPLSGAFAEILGQLNQGVAVYDAEGRLIFCNQTYRVLYPETPLALPCQPDKSAIEPAFAERIAATGVDHSRSDGRILEMAQHILPEGLRLELYSDVTAVKLAEQRLFNIVTGAQVCVWEWNVKTSEHSVNGNWAKLLGYSLAELEPITYDTWRSRVHPDDLAAVEELFDRALIDDDVRYRTEYRLRHRDGHWIWVLDEGRALYRNADGLAEFIVGSQVDISDQKARETALAALTADLEQSSIERAKVERRLTDIVSVSDGWVWEMDESCRFNLVLDGQFFNDGGVPASELYGLTQEEWLAAHPDMLPGIPWEIMLKAIQDRKPFQDFVYRAPKSTDGVVRWRRMTGTPIFDEDGTFTGYRGVGSDVTELYLAKARAEDASHTKSMFLANMSHEIRTPLNGVLGMAEVLEASLSQPDQKRMIGTIRRSGESLLNILNDILDMSKIEAGKLDMEHLAFNPTDIAQRVEDMHSLAAEEKGIAFEVLLGSGADTPRLGDPYRVQQILHNIISNAIKFTDSGTVKVKISGHADQPLLIEVRDTGIGMSPDQILRIHEEFSQADSSVTRRFGGTGLGMAITRSLVDSMAGEIEVASALGEGTSFRVTLPLEIAPDFTERPPERRQDQGDLKGVRMLAADDNATNCMVLEMMLTRLGAEVTIVTDGAAAVQAWAPGRFDCILLDITMPGMSGTEALEKIRALEVEHGLEPGPIIAATANAMSHQVLDYLTMGFDSCLAKPISSAALSHSIRALISS